jgi:D-alanine-D-alanine ligase
MPSKNAEVLLPSSPAPRGEARLVPLAGASPGVPSAAAAFDVVFPVVHGPLCEDGTLQGLLEMADVPYVGAGVLASAVGMDKDVAKRLARDAGLPIVPFVTLRKGDWQLRAQELSQRIERELGFPAFIKPSNMGSSVGVHKVKSASELRAAVEDAFRYDVKVLAEKAVDAREIEFAVLENPRYGEAPLVSIAGEINPKHEFYSYEAKYLDENGADMAIPAHLTEAQLDQGKKIAAATFAALECEGMARVDLFLDRKTGAYFLNEVNTIPGFTHISMYPKLWEASGIGYSELLTRLIELAIARHSRKTQLKRER